MGIIDKLKQTAKGAKGKSKAATGKAVGNRRLQAEGRAEQTKADVEHAAEKTKDTARNLGQEAKGKAKEVAGAVTDNEGRQVSGKAEQVAARTKQRFNK